MPCIAVSISLSSNTRERTAYTILIGQVPQHSTSMIIADKHLSVSSRSMGPGSLQGFDAFEALEQGINKPSVDDTYTALQFQIVSSSKIGVYKDGVVY